MRKNHACDLYHAILWTIHSVDIDSRTVHWNIVMTFMSCNVSRRITLLEVQDETCTVFEPSLLTQIRIIDPSLVHFTLQFHCKDKGGMRAVKYFCENILHRQHPKLVQDVVDVPFSVVCNFNFPSFSSISFIEHKIEFSQWMRGPKGWPIATLPTCSYKVGH